MNKAAGLFKSYVKALEKQEEEFVRNFEDKTLSNDLDAYDRKLKEKLETGIKEWEDTPNEELGGMTPALYINSLNSRDQFIDLLKQGSQFTQGDLPEVFMDRLSMYKDSIKSFLMDSAADISMIDSESEFLLPLAAIRILGRWGIDEAIPLLLDILFKLEEDNELFMEEIRKALVGIGKPSMEPVAAELERGAAVDVPREHLLMALADIGENNKSDRVYGCLKNTFLRMDNKAIGAICLGNYGDGRAIPALRGYLQKNPGKVDKTTFYEVKAAIEKLGGSIDDIGMKPVF